MGTESNMRPSLLSSDFFLYFGTSVNPGFGNKITSFSVGASDRADDDCLICLEVDVRFREYGSDVDCPRGVLLRRLLLL